MSELELVAEKKPMKLAIPGCKTQILKWVLSGATEREIREQIAAAMPEEDATALLEEVMIGFEKIANFNVDVVIGWCFEATRDLYRRMVENADFAGALRAVKQLAEIARNHVPSTEAETAASEEGSR